MTKQLIYHMTGAIYSANKHEWKKVYGVYGLKWVGDQETWVWLGDGEKMVAFFEANEYGKKEAIVMWEGDSETEFYCDFKEFWSDVKGAEVLDELPSDKNVSDEELKNWIMFNKPDYEAMRKPSILGTHSGAPDEYVDAARKDYEVRLAKKKEELGIE